MSKLNRELFTNEQWSVIQALIESNDPEKIPKAIILDSPAQEIELQRFLDETRGGKPVIDSKVRAKMQEIRVRNEEPIASPEEEAEWQALIDAENNGKDPFADEVVGDEDGEEDGEKGIDATDSAIELANEHSIDLATVTGSGTKGRIVKSDVQTIVDALASEGDDVGEEEGTPHVLTEADLKSNPGLVEKGLKVGDTITLSPVGEETE